jgi:hypothetical protein
VNNRDAASSDTAPTKVECIDGFATRFFSLPLHSPRHQSEVAPPTLQWTWDWEKVLKDIAREKDHPPDGGETDEKKTYGFGWIGPWSKIASANRPSRPSF